MDESGRDEMSAEQRAVTRRRVLQGAVAAGVGAAVWTAPHITTLGAAPAYASHGCSKASTVSNFTSECKSTSSPSECNPAGPARYYQLNLTSGFGTSGTVTANAPGCTDGVSTVSIVPPTGLRCRIKTLKIYPSNGDCVAKTNVLNSAPAGSLTIPLVNWVTPSNKEWSMDIECVASGGCFPDEVVG